MTTFRTLIENYIAEASDDDMQALTCKIDAFVEEVRQHHPDMVDKFLMQVDFVLNPGFTRETAKYAVSKFKNKDGSIGEHWDYETTSKVLGIKGYTFNPCNWYFALNRIYSVFFKPGRSDDTYIELAHDYLSDKNFTDENMLKKHWIAMHY